MGVVNVLFGARILKDGVDVTRNVAEKMEKELKAEGVKVGLFHYVSTQEEVKTAIVSNKYDVVVCQEMLSGDNIGGGSVKQWITLNPRVRVILLIGQEKKGKVKVENLYSKYNYYDALYGSEVSGANLAQLINTPRTKEAALIYYGLSEENIVEDVADNISDIIQEENEVMSNDGRNTESNEEKEVPSQIKDSNEDTVDFDEQLRSMGGLFDAQSEEQEENFKNDISGFSNQKGGNEAMRNENSSLLGGESFFEGARTSVVQETLKNRRPEDEQLGGSILKDYSEQGYTQGMSNTYNSMKEGSSMYSREEVNEKEYGLAVAENRYKQQGNKLHVNGVVSAIVDATLMLVVFDKPISFDDVNGVSNFSFTLLVHTKAKAHIEKGRYVTNILPLKGYGSCMIDDYTAVLEIVDANLFDLVEKIQNMDCNIIMVRQ